MEETLNQPENTQPIKPEDPNQDELSEFIETLVTENTGLKRQLVLNEIELIKYKEMLVTSCSKYFNFESGNLNETDKKYYDAIRQINMDHDKKLDEINTKYAKETEKLIAEHNDIIAKINKFGADNIEEKETINKQNILEKVDMYEKQLKTSKEELYNSEKYAQILQMKYETLLQENEFLKNKIPEEKEQLLLLIEDLKQNQTDKLEEITKSFHTNCDLITETYSTLCANEKNKETLIMDNLFSEKDNLDDRIKILLEDNQKLKSENESLKSENKRNDDFFSKKALEVSTIKGLKEKYNSDLQNYQDEITKLKSENIDLKKNLNESQVQISILEKKVKNVQEAIDSKVSNLNEKNVKLVDDLNNKIINLDTQKRELAFNLEQNSKNYNNKLEKAKAIIEENERLKQTTDELKFKISELEAMNNSLNNQLENIQRDYKSLYEKNETFSKMMEEYNTKEDKDKIKFKNMENALKKIQSEFNTLEIEKNKLQTDYENLSKVNNKNIQNFEKEKINTEVELKKLHKTIETYERKLNSTDSNNFTFQFDVKSSIQKIYKIYVTKFRKSNSLNYMDETKMLKDMETNLEADLDSLLRGQKGGNPVYKDNELQKYKKKMELIREITETALQKNEENLANVDPVNLINNLEKNRQLTKFYENLLIHIQSTNLLHLLQIFKLNCDNEQAFLLYVNRTDNSSDKYDKLNKKVNSIQNQFDNLNRQITQNINELKQRGLSYIMLEDFVKVQKIFEDSLAQITTHMLSSFQQYLSKQIANDDQYVIFTIPIENYNYILEQIETFSRQSIKKGRDFINEKVEQGNMILQAIDAIYYITSNPANVELINRMIQEKFI